MAEKDERLSNIASTVTFNLSESLIRDVSNLINTAKSHVAREYNSTQLMLCWLLGNRVEEEILRANRAEYGERIIEGLAKYLLYKYGRGYSRANLFKMIKFAKLFPDQQIVLTLSRQLSWSHIIILCAIEDKSKREFYLEMGRVQNWSVRELKKQVESLLFERTGISKKPEKIIKSQLDNLKQKNEMTYDLVFKDPYFINFIGAQDFETEKSLEQAILNNITDFLHELGSEFCFVARQKRMSTQNKDRYLDLLFFHRRLRRLIAIDLKIGDFEPAYKGQMEWYLNWLDQNERLPNEEKPIGIILCAGKDQEDIEYLEMDKTGIHVAQYITELPPREILEEKLKLAIIIAKENYGKKIDD